MLQLRIKKSATIVELVIIIVVVAIIGATIAGVILHFIQLFIYSPRQLDTQKIAQELTYTMTEGDADVRGMRYTRSIIDANATQFSYTYGYPPTAANQLSVRFRWDGANNQIHRSTSTDGGGNWSSESAFPYYIHSSTTVDGQDTAGTIFTYKKADESAWTPGVDIKTTIRRVILDINVKTQEGVFDDFEGSTDITSSVEIKNYQ